MVNIQAKPITSAVTGLWNTHKYYPLFFHQKTLDCYVIPRRKGHIYHLFAMIQMKKKHCLGPSIGLNCKTENPQNQLTFETKLFFLLLKSAFLVAHAVQ